VRVLLDESVPRPLAAHLPGHEVETVTGLGWAGISNGELLRRAAGSFDVLVTGDQNLEYQQNLRGLRLDLVVIVARDNRVETIVALAGEILRGIEEVRPSHVVRVAG
jgi:hypothetical protein